MKQPATSMHDEVVDDWLHWDESEKCGGGSLCRCCDEFFVACCPCCVADLKAYPLSVEVSGSQFAEPKIWKLIRGVFAILTGIILVIDLAYWASRGRFGFWFIYFTHWAFVSAAVYLLLAFSETMIVYSRFEKEGHVVTLKQMNRSRFSRVSRVFMNTALSTSIVAAIVFWTLLYRPGEDISGFDLFLDAYKHGVTGSIMIVDAIISASWFRHKDVIFPFLFGVVFLLWSGIHWVARIGNPSGHRYIYSFLNYAHVGRAIGFILVLLFVVFPILHFSMVCAANMTRKRCNPSKVWDNLPIQVAESKRTLAEI